MPTPGRNDPCPCGSGKKYKNCCFRQDRVSASRQLGAAMEEEAMLGALVEYAQGPRFQNDLVTAFHFFWGGRYDLDTVAQLHPDDVRRTLEWFVHDYHTSTDRRTVLDLFIEREGARYIEAARAVLNAWAASALGLFRMLERTGDDTLDMYDCLRQEPLTVLDRSLARNGQPGDLAVGRWYELGGAQRLSMATLLLPAEFEPGLTAYVTNAYRLYQDEHPGADWVRFLRENGHIVNAYLLSAQAEPLRRLLGPGTRFHDPAITRDRLREHTRQVQIEAQRQARQAEEPKLPMRRTASGLILPGAEPEAKPEDKGRAKEPEAPRPRILIPGRDA
ncbi:MAG: SEC-C metal-binding domain-containing protein [Chloroflexota bacterium]